MVLIGERVLCQQPVWSLLHAEVLLKENSQNLGCQAGDLCDDIMPGLYILTNKIQTTIYGYTGFSNRFSASGVSNNLFRITFYIQLVGLFCCWWFFQISSSELYDIFGSWSLNNCGSGFGILPSFLLFIKIKYEKWLNNEKNMTVKIFLFRFLFCQKIQFVSGTFTVDHCDHNLS